MTSIKVSRGGAVAIAVVLLCIAAYVPFLAERFGDFRAFYCSGHAVLLHADPYREHPLRDCERAVQATGVSQLRDDAAIPSPFPGYVLALFALLALLPFGAAAALWLAGSIVAVAFACLFFARALRVPVTALAIVIGFPAVSAAIQLGQITPFVALAISGAALLLVRGKPRCAAIAALGITLEPHVAAAAIVGLFVGVRQARVPLVVGCAALILISLVTLGPQGNLEYLRDVLPQHALANISDIGQFSAAHFAALFGVAAPLARTIGSWWYLASALAGVAVALRLKGRYGPAAVVLVPIAFEVFGGVYVHVSQLAFGIPAFLLVLPERGRARSLGVIALFLAATPWNMIVNYPMLVPAIGVLAIALCVCMRVERLAIGLAAGAAVLCLIFLATGLAVLVNPARGFGGYHPPGNPLADVSWQYFEQWLAAHRTPATRTWATAVKFPTLIAFAALLAMLGAASRRRDGETGKSPIAQAARLVASVAES